jgi:hypothetical protein
MAAQKSEGAVETHQEKTQKPDKFETEPSTFGLCPQAKISCFAAVDLHTLNVASFAFFQ